MVLTSVNCAQGLPSNIVSPKDEDLRNTMSLRYKYSPMDQDGTIRLLSLEPTESHGSSLQASLTIHHLDQKSHYEALSYAWGDAVFPVDLELESGSLKITEHLASALRHLRLSDQKRNLWIDAVCINQQDNEEKGQQVGMMAEIYKMASEVLIWLGEATEQTSTAFDALHKLAESAVSYGIEGNADRKLWNDPKLKSDKENADQLIRLAGLKELDDFYQRSWFTRLWIVQEVALAPTINIYCGSLSMGWIPFVTATTLIKAAKSSLPEQFYDLISFERAWQIIEMRGYYVMGRHIFFTSPYDEFRTLVEKTRYQSCSDERDRIYALLGITLHRNRENTTLLDINYSETPSQLYTRFSQHFLAQGDIEILHHATLNRRFSPNFDLISQETVWMNPSPDSDYLPSWAVDFRPHVMLQPSPLWNLGSFSAGLRPASIGTSNELPWQIFVKALTLGSTEKGCFLKNTDPVTNLDDVRLCINQCKHLFLSTINRFETSDAFLMTIDFVRRIVAAGPSFPGGKDLLAEIAFARAIVADGSGWCFNGDEGRDASKPKPAGELLQYWKQYEASLLNDDGDLYLRYKKYEEEHGKMDDSFIKSLDAKDTRIWMYHVVLRRALERHQFIVTDTGFMGWAPRITGMRHVLAIIAGMRTPVMLERVANSESFVLLGPCYIQGIMQGETCEIGRWDQISLL